MPLQVDGNGLSCAVRRQRENMDGWMDSEAWTKSPSHSPPYRIADTFNTHICPNLTTCLPGTTTYKVQC